MYAADGARGSHYREFESWLSRQSDDLMRLKRAEPTWCSGGSASPFAVYGESAGTERLIPFDVDSAHHPGRRVAAGSRPDCASA